MRPASDDTPVVISQPASSRTAYRLPAVSASGDDSRSASGRLRALAALSGSLTDALTPAEAATFVENEALSALGATSAVVVTLGVFPPASTPPSTLVRDPVGAPALILVHAVGLPEEVQATLKQLPLDSPVPLAEVARDGESIFLHSSAEILRYPAWGAAMVAAGANAASIVPVWANGELRGVLALTWGTPRSFDEDERAFVITLGIMCAQAIMRAHLRDAEQRAREAAEHANRSKAHFLATISHEIRTPLNAMMGYTQLLADEIYGSVSQLQKDQLGRVRASGAHLLELVEELLGYARIEAGEEVVRPEHAQLATVVEQSIVLVRPLAEKKGLEIRVEGYAEALELFTDVRKVRQILVNLLANAIKFSTSGDIVLLLRFADDGIDPLVYFEVIDTGRGIAVENHEHIFDAFWQDDSAIMHAMGSTGLGLSVARELARLLGGDVLLVRSVLARGSTFVAALPAKYEKAARAISRS
ncbi:MAG: ATP-binding protein [Gemmatimonadota bacterium]